MSRYAVLCTRLCAAELVRMVWLLCDVRVRHTHKNAQLHSTHVWWHAVQPDVVERRLQSRRLSSELRRVGLERVELRCQLRHRHADAHSNHHHACRQWWRLS